MPEEPGNAQEATCGHGLPQGAACPACISEVVRNILGMAAAQQAGAAPTPLAANAIQSHELLTAHITAGFTRAEAMQVVLLVYYVTMLKGPYA
jgi:hypothetical protein